MRIRLFDSVAALARDAAADAASVLVRQLSAKASVRLVAATGSTQIAFLEALVASPGIDWSRVELFHLDEYLGIGASHPASFARFIRERIVEPAGIGRAHLMDGLADPADLIRRLDEELARAPVDLAFTGVGENGHLAFNEPPAMFTTDARFMPVELDEVSRRQQVREEWFSALDEVPTHAITMTIPAILAAREILCLVHGERKARAVAACFDGPPDPAAPASILTTHEAATVYMDGAAASLLRPATLGPGGR